MPQQANVSPTVPRIRPLSPYEPFTRFPSTHAAADGQLNLPFSATPSTPAAPREPTGPEHDAEVEACAPAPPSQRELKPLLTALIEVALGQRPLTRVRHLLSENVYRTLSTSTAKPPGTRYVLANVHHCRPASSAMEVCATAHERTHAIAALARLERQWHGWRCTRFALIVPSIAP